MTLETAKRIAKAAGTFSSSVSRLNTLEAARSISRRTVKMSMITKVEDEYWVATPAETQRLNRLGYEIIRTF